MNTLNISKENIWPISNAHRNFDNYYIYNIKLDISDSAKDYLVENGYDPAFGARPLKRLVGRTVEVLLSNMIINNEIKPNSTYLIDYKNDKFVIEKE